MNSVPSQQPAEAESCRRSDLATWSFRGGVLPSSLSEHIRHCNACAEQVRRVSEVHAGLTLLRTQASPPELLPRANGRALRFLRRAARASAAAQRLLRIRPNLTPWQRAGLHLTRLSVGAAAALLMLVVRTGLLSGFERTREIGEHFAQQRWLQADPTGESMGSRGIT